MSEVYSLKLVVLVGIAYAFLHTADIIRCGLAFSSHSIPHLNTPLNGRGLNAHYLK